MREVTEKVYTIDELSEKAREKAYYKWLEFNDYAWSSDNEKTLKEFANTFDITIANWEYDTCRHHVRFSVNNDFLEEMQGQRLATYIHNNFYDNIIKGKYYSTKGIYVDGKYNYVHRYSKIIIEKYNCSLTGYYIDNEILAPVFEFLEKPNKHTTFESLMEECLDRWGETCVSDFESCTSMEYFIEQSKDNKWEYYIDGRQY